MTVLVIDVGSSSARAILFDEQACSIPGAVASREYQFTTTPPGAAVIDAEFLRQITEICMDEVLEHPQAKDIRVVSMAAFTDSMVGIDKAGAICTPLYTYADTRSAEDVDTLSKQIDLHATHQRTGCINHTTYYPGRLHWLRRTAPDTFEAVTEWIDVNTYFYRTWFGSAPTSYSMASWTGLLNRATLEWDQTWLEHLGIDASALPDLADYNDMQVGLLDAYAQRWPVLRDVPFCLGVGDGAAANVGSGAVDEAHIGLTVGTTAALRVITDAALPPVPPGLWSYRLDAAHHVIGGATFEGGNIFRWAGDVLDLPDENTIDKALSQREPDAHGLTFLPLFGGERSPGWVGDATGSINGLRLSTTALDLLQAALEGVALRLALTADQLVPVAAQEAAIMAGGGALAASPVWGQIIANALNRPLHLVAEAEITGRGAAILALKALGRGALSDYPPVIERTLHPDPDHAAVLRAALERQVEWYQKVVIENNGD